MIDDEKKLNDLLSRILSLEGFNVLQAYTAKQGLSMLHQEDIVLVISDVKLPDANGVELVKAIKQIKPGGILFTFSCSQVIDRYTFNSTIMAAAIEAGKNVRVLHHLSQPPDHPVNIFHPEGEYLKGLVLYIE